MKKLIALSAILSMSVALADDVVYGTFVLNSSEPELILGVPWINPGSDDGTGSDDGAIKVKDLIQTSTLAVGDLLYYYSGSYKAWIVATENDQKVWKGFEVVKANEKGEQIIEANEGGEEKLVRGNAIILKRPGVENRSNKNIIINGQVGSGSIGTITMAQAQGDKWAYTLLAPPSAEAKKLSQATWGGKIGMNDRIIIGNALPYTYNAENGEWGHETVDRNGDSDWSDTDPTIPAGQGAWYVSTDGTGEAVTCTWK